ncbi:MAG: DUF2007 domain-containing protein [Pseudomonadota bacterium]
MEELLRTTDPATVPFVEALLSGEDIDCVVFDSNMSIVEGSIGAFPRRIMVWRKDLYRARIVLIDNGIEPTGGAGDRGGPSGRATDGDR